MLLHISFMNFEICACVGRHVAKSAYLLTFINLYRGSPTCTVSTSTNSTSAIETGRQNLRLS